MDPAQDVVDIGHSQLDFDFAFRAYLCGHGIV
jgi:hypothetical protein